jgi:hypothetical protein
MKAWQEELEFFYNSYLQPEIMHDEQESEKNIAQQLDHLFIVLTWLNMFWGWSYRFEYWLFLLSDFAAPLPN